MARRRSEGIKRLGRFALAGLAIAAMAIGAWPGSAAAATSSDDWATFHHDALHTGVSPDTVIGAAAAPSLSVQWSHPVGGGSTDPVYASPAVASNTTLAKTLVYDVSLSGMVRAYDTTGAEIWTSPQNVGGGAVGSPAVDGNTLYVGSDNGVLTALDATTGALQCSYTLPIYAPETAPGRIEDAPVVGHDITGPIVYFGDTGQSESVNHGHEWAINGVGNTAGACTPKWAHDLGSTGGKHSGSWSPPALVTDSIGRPLLVFGTGQPDDAVYALDARDGSLVWRFQTLKNFSDADVGAGPTISAPGVNGFAHGVVYIDGKDKQEYAIDLLTGTQLWTFDMESDTAHSTNSVSCAALVGNLVVVAYWKYVYAFNATTGAKVWRSVAGAGSTLGSVSVSGAPGDQVVLRADLSGDEYAYRLSDGSLLKTIKVASTSFASSTAVADGMAFIAGEDGNLYALGVPGSLTPGTITGTVTDSTTSNPISGATVSCTCSGTNQTTGGGGSYTFSSVAPGTYSMTFSASGYASQTVNNVTVTSGTTTTVPPVALSMPGTITGTVTDSSTTNPISGATVSCTCSGTNQTTDGTGSYTFSSVPPGTYSMTFSASGHVSKTVNGVIVTSGTTTTEPVALTPGTTAPTLVQEVDKAAGAAGTSASVPPASTKAGDLLVLSVTMDAGSGKSSGSIAGVTDSSGSDTWTRAVADNPSTRIGAEVWYVANAPAGITLVTASFSTPVNAVLRVYEIQGAPANPLDQVHAAAGSGTSVSSGPTSTTSGSNDILIATVGFVSTSATISGLTSGFSNDLLVRNSLTNFNNSEQAGHEIVTSTGAYSYGGTLSGSQAWAAAIAAFE